MLCVGLSGARHGPGRGRPWPAWACLVPGTGQVARGHGLRGPVWCLAPVGVARSHVRSVLFLVPSLEFGQKAAKEAIQLTALRRAECLEQ
jgi:hypothetical protein